MRFNVVAVLMLAVVLAGCAGSSAKNPIVPFDLTKNHAAVATNRHVWGIWDVNISADWQKAEIAPMRTADMHLNAVKLLEVKPCATCLKIGNIQITSPNELSADLTLTHPYPGLVKYTGFDVRGIFISQADYTFATSGRKIAWSDSVSRMLEPDGYTSLFNPTEFPTTTPAALGYIPGKHATGGDLSANLNPYLAYRKDAPRRMFEAGGSETKTVKIHALAGPIHFGYAVDVCWQLVESVIDPVQDFPPDANCLEAYAISVDIGSGLQPVAGSSVPIAVKVYDHQGQDTISSVMVEAPDLFAGEMSLNFSTTMPDEGFLFTGTLSNDLGAGIGTYPVLVKATDKQADQNLGEVAAWQISSAIISPPKGWARTWGGIQEDYGFSVAIDGYGNAYVTGSFGDTVDFDPGPGVDYRTAIGMNATFLSKFDTNGNLVWARTWGGQSYTIGNSVALDGFGNLYVAGAFGGTVDFDPGAGVDEHTSIDGDAFLSKFDLGGNFIWARTWGGLYNSFVEASSVAIDGSGNAYLAGEFKWQVDFDPGPGEDIHKSYNYNEDVYLSKLDPDGNFLWARTWGWQAPDAPTSLAIDILSNPCIVGRCPGPVDFDPGPGEYFADPNHDVFFSKFDANGNFLWVKTWGGPNALYLNSITVDGSGNYHLTGSFSETVDFDPGINVDKRTSNGKLDVYLIKLDPNGDYVWTRTWGGLIDDQGNSLSIDSYGSLYAAGGFRGTADFDPGPGVENHSAGDMDGAFLSKFDLDGNFLWARTWAGVLRDRSQSVATDSIDNAYVAGLFEKIVDFDPGPGIDYHTSNGSYDVFLSKFPPDGNW